MRDRTSQPGQSGNQTIDAGAPHLEVTATTPRSCWLAIWQDEPCPSWCAEFGDHAHDEPRETRWHVSKWLTIDRPGLDAVPDNDGEFRLRRSGVRLKKSAQHSSQANPVLYVQMRTEDDDGHFPDGGAAVAAHPMTMTASEALDFAELIRRTACLGLNEGLSAGAPK